MIKEEPTGERRYRAYTRFLRAPLLVLQVEIRRHGTWSDASDPYLSTYTQDVDATFWRDAKAEDLGACQ